MYKIARIFAIYPSPGLDTVLYLILRIEKKISILKNARFSGKGRQSLHVTRIRKNLR